MSEKLETLNIVQQVLRGVVVSLAVSQRIDMPRCASSLQAFAAGKDLDPMAVQMLLDLAQGLDMIGKAAQGQPHQ